jgi:nitronate monooxygenase
MTWKNSVTSLLKIEYPIIQAPMLVVTTPAMVASACEAGCLGTLPLGYSAVAKASENIRAVKALTDKPFAVNVFAYDRNISVPEKEPQTLKTYYQKFGLPPLQTVPKEDPFTYYTALIDLLLEEKIPVISFHFGLPSREVIDRLKEAGVVLIATATSVKEAKLIEQAGLDIIVAQGIEAGGNRGSFVEGELPQIGLFSLLPQIVDGVKLPVIAAGGIMHSRHIAAAFLLGAQGVQLGSYFLLSDESNATASWKQAVKSSKDETTVLTKAWSGKWGRCIPTSFVTDINETEIFPSPVQQYLTSALREVGRKNDIPDIQSFWAGQSAQLAKEGKVSQLLKELIGETERLLTAPFSF